MHTNRRKRANQALGNPRICGISLSFLFQVHNRRRLLSVLVYGSHTQGIGFDYLVPYIFLTSMELVRLGDSKTDTVWEINLELKLDGHSTKSRLKSRISSEIR